MDFPSYQNRTHLQLQLEIDFAKSDLDLLYSRKILLENESDLLENRIKAKMNELEFLEQYLDNLAKGQIGSVNN